MNFISTSHVHRNQNAFRRSSLASVVALSFIGLCPAHAADKPPLAPDTAVPFSTNSRLSAGIEFSLPALAADIERDIPQRLASIDEKIECVHRRILFFKVNANCDVWGYVERSGASHCTAAATASTARCRSMACSRGRAPTASRRASMARPKPAPPSKPRRVRSSAGTGRSTSISATVPMERAAGAAGDGPRDSGWQNTPSRESGHNLPWSGSMRWPQPAASICMTRPRRRGGMRSSRSSSRIARRSGCR